MSGHPDEAPPGAAPRGRAFLLPGRIYCARDPVEVSTVLGSCVAVCLTDRRRRVSGMNHFVLPNSDGDHDGLRYGDVSIERLVVAMEHLCGGLDDVEAKVFGGAEILAPAASGGIGVGARNVALALERLDYFRLPVVAQRTGDANGLLIRLHSDTGDVMVRPIVPSWPEASVVRAGDVRSRVRP